MNKWIAAIILGLLSLCATAQEEQLKGSAGYIDFSMLDGVYGEPRVMINIGGVLLQFMAAASREDPEAAELMRGLEGVRVHVYSTEGLIEPALAQVSKVKGLLQEQKWQPVVQVKEEGEEVQIFMKTGSEGIQGLTVMAVNEEEAVFLNILGDIDPAKLGKVMDQLDVDIDME